jgi:hypothetical protein
MPIEGTTQIKSHRYMKLEAGSGNATIKHDRYTTNKHLGIDDADKLNQTQLLMSAIKLKIDDINSKIDRFTPAAQQKWDDCFTAMSNYKTHANTRTYLKVIGNPDIKTIISKAKEAATGSCSMGRLG